ncbi:MHS family MFS transporter [Acinetobacter qingfengensis]|uniref:LysR family transcriptional regulator n=1 Tax=Acinetobacter qingfengensis TaxID=1262585 RepID=A0A1E7QYV1_9GAMM|nr:MFS transporter [Acinetobacter qingfengensis]KAA8730982.1 MHS family MFS transporter [Acinetobacter qingfengensis]OEY92239.1 LysR family transcriptional regulator [Acinetobacter qingfengensis]
MEKDQSKRAAAAAFMGTTIEFYDFYVYATAAALVLGHVFFPTTDPVTGTLAAFATFAVGFIARPLAGLIFGHLGDKLGRKNMLLFTMILMGIATTGIGLIPSYASIGIWAPILLIVLRFLQGISVGGEWGGAVLMASEHAPSHKKTFFASFAQLGSPAGLILCLLVFKAVTSLDEADFLSWGWRIPFLLSFVLMAVGFIIRFGVKESPEFAQAKAQAETVKYPLKNLFKYYWPHVIFAGLAITIGSAGFFFTNTFMITYVTQYLGIERQTILSALFWVTVLQFLTMPLFALWAEKIGAARFLVGIAVVCLIVPYPMFMLVETKNILLITLGITLAVVSLSALYAVVAGFMANAFPTEVRYSGISVSYQFIAALAGGTTPIIGTLLAKNYAGEWLPLAYLFTFLSAMSLVGILGVNYLQRKNKVAENTAALSNEEITQ